MKVNVNIYRNKGAWENIEKTTNICDHTRDCITRFFILVFHQSHLENSYVFTKKLKFDTPRQNGAPSPWDRIPRHAPLPPNTQGIQNLPVWPSHMNSEDDERNNR
jgi:hypothetical protein